MDNQKTKIVKQITGGFISIDSVEEFEELLIDFPEDPALHKAHADLLVKKNSSDEAALSGKIAWTKETIFKGEKTLAVGIQFQDLSPKLRGMLFVFADNSKDK